MKNKIKLIGLAILTWIVSLPTALAGPNTDAFDNAVFFLGPYRWFLVNGFILFGVLHIIQNYIFKQTTAKGKQYYWIISLLITLTISWFISGGLFIWQFPRIGFLFDIHTIVNAAIIGALISFILPLLEIKLTSKQAQYGSYLLIGIISLVVASNIGPEWIWKKQSIATLIAYLFGAEGILSLNPANGNYNLLIFLIVFLVIVWIFTHFKIAESQKKITYALSILIAASITRGGLSIEGAAKFLQVAAILILGNQLSKSWTASSRRMRVFAYVVIAALVQWAAVAVDPKYSLLGAEWVWGASQLSGTFDLGIDFSPSNIWGYLKVAGIILAVLIVVGILYVTIGNNEDKEKVKGRAVPLGMNRLTDSLNQGLLSYLPFVKKLRSKYGLVEGMLPKSLQKLRAMLQVLTDYVSRLSTIHSNSRDLDKIGERVSQIQSKISVHKDLNRLRYELMVYRSGGVIKGDSNLTYRKGFNAMNIEVVRVFNKISKTTAETREKYHIINNALQNISTPATREALEKLFPKATSFTKFEPTITQLKNEIAKDYGEFKTRSEAYKGHQAIRAEFLLMLDQFHIDGIFPRSYRFAVQGAELEGGGHVSDSTTEVTFNNFGEPGTLTGSIEAFQISSGTERITGAAYNANRGSFQRLRNPSESKNHTNLLDVIAWYKSEYEAALRDLRYGEFHPSSRTFSDYANSWQNYKWKDSQVQKSGTPSSTDPAVDQRALADPSFRYWGRPGYNKDINSVNSTSFPNPYPALTTQGMTLFINQFIEEKEDEIQKVKQFIAGQPADTLKGHTTDETPAGSFSEVRKEENA